MRLKTRGRAVKIRRLVIKEILYRKLGFILGLVSVVVAVGSMVAALTLLKVHDARTELILEQKKAETQSKMQILENDVKKAMLNLGFNIVIVPKDQNLGDWHADDYGSKYMPEEYVERLLGSGIVSGVAETQKGEFGGPTIEQLLPRLRQKVKWPETKWTIILVGTGGFGAGADEAANAAVEMVRRGSIVLGNEVHEGLGLKVGDKLRLMGSEFVVGKCNEERGTKDDITVWVNLQQGQELLDKKGLINEILALECRSSLAEMPKVRADITRILPETQVIEKSSEVLAKRHAYMKVAEESEAAIFREQESRSHLRGVRKRFATVLIPLVVAVCTVWVGLLVFGNVRARQGEIGILRTLGYRWGQILWLFLLRSVIMGLAGGIVGFLVGVVLAGVLTGPVDGDGGIGQLVLNFGLLWPALFVSIVITTVASWIPATLAGRQDPAVILRNE